jgi:hypothetical protein
MLRSTLVGTLVYSDHKRDTRPGQALTGGASQPTSAGGHLRRCPRVRITTSPGPSDTAERTTGWAEECDVPIGLQGENGRPEPLAAAMTARHIGRARSRVGFLSLAAPKARNSNLERCRLATARFAIEAETAEQAHGGGHDSSAHRSSSLIGQPLPIADHTARAVQTRIRGTARRKTGDTRGAEAHCVALTEP